MKFKKIMLVTFLLLAILTIGAVSASEDTLSVGDVSFDESLAVDDAQEDLAENPVEEIIATDDENEILADDSANSNVTINLEPSVDYSSDYGYIAYVRDENSLNGTITLSIDGNQYYSNDFDGSRASKFIYPSDLKDFNFENFLGNHSVNVTYNGISKESVVLFVFEPYFFQPYYGGIGDSSAIVFKAVSSSSGSASLYNAVYNNETDNYEPGTLIGTYPINGSLSIVPLPVLSEKGYNVFCVNYTIDGKNKAELFAVYASENSKQITSELSASQIRPGDSITLKITTPKSGYVDVYVDGEYASPVLSMVNGTAQKTFSNLAAGQHAISLYYDNYGTNNETYSKTYIVSVSNSTVKTSDIADAKLSLSKTAFTYNGKVQMPTVTLKDGDVLKEGVDYTLQWSIASAKNAGTYSVTVTGIGAYTGTAKATFTINKAANPLAVKAKTAKVKFSAVKKKAQTLAVSKVVTFSKKGQGTLTYAKSSGNKKITINKKTGKVTVAKGLKKGTYKVKIKIKAGGNANYKASAYKTVTFKITIK